MPATITTKRFNVDEYHRMAEAGILGREDRVQLIDGEVVVMAAIGSSHVAAVSRLTRLFSRACDDQIVQVQGPVRLGVWSEPEPDICILRPKDDYYEAAHATPKDVLLVVEVSDTSVAFDREVKLPLYARAGIVEYWIVDVNARSVEVHLDPGPEGYRRFAEFLRGESLTPAALPDVTLRVDDITP